MSAVTKLAFAMVYADDSAKAVAFYTKYLGLVVDPEFKMGPDEYFGNMGTVGLWIGGGYKRQETNEKTVRATAMLRVESAGQLFSAFKKDGVKVFHDAPVKMNEDSHWFQFADPSGNIWDVLGNA